MWKGSDSGSQEAATYTTKFEYPGSGNLEYTSCSVGGDITTPDNANTALADFAFLAAIAYEAPDITNTTLQEWFDPTDTESEVAIDHQDVVDAFKAEYEAKNGASAVTYKLLGFPNTGVGIVTIRGTSNGWDALADAQLWSSAAIAQWLRALVPLVSALDILLIHFNFAHTFTLMFLIILWTGRCVYPRFGIFGRGCELDPS